MQINGLVYVIRKELILTYRLILSNKRLITESATTDSDCHASLF